MSVGHKLMLKSISFAVEPSFCACYADACYADACYADAYTVVDPPRPPTPSHIAEFVA
jgi:hypothetical protein